MSEHSPLPWSLFGDGSEPAPGIDSADDVSVVVWGEGGHDDAGVQGETPEQAKANAAFIVKAVNAHDELVNVLDAARDAIEYSIAAHGTDHGGMMLQALNRIDTALAKVKP